MTVLLRVDSGALYIIERTDNGQCLNVVRLSFSGPLAACFPLSNASQPAALRPQHVCVLTTGGWLLLIPSPASAARLGGCHATSPLQATVAAPPPPGLAFGRPGLTSAAGSIEPQQQLRGKNGLGKAELPHDDEQGHSKRRCLGAGIDNSNLPGRVLPVDMEQQQQLPQQQQGHQVATSIKPALSLRVPPHYLWLRSLPGLTCSLCLECESDLSGNSMGAPLPRPQGIPGGAGKADAPAATESPVAAAVSSTATVAEDALGCWQRLPPFQQLAAMSGCAHAPAARPLFGALMDGPSARSADTSGRLPFGCFLAGNRGGQVWAYPLDHAAADGPRCTSGAAAARPEDSSCGSSIPGGLLLFDLEEPLVELLAIRLQGGGDGEGPGAGKPQNVAGPFPGGAAKPAALPAHWTAGVCAPPNDVLLLVGARGRVAAVSASSGFASLAGPSFSVLSNFARITGGNGSGSGAAGRKLTVTDWKLPFHVIGAAAGRGSLLALLTPAGRVYLAPTTAATAATAAADGRGCGASTGRPVQQGVAAGACTVSTQVLVPELTPVRLLCPGPAAAMAWCDGGLELLIRLESGCLLRTSVPAAATTGATTGAAATAAITGAAATAGTAATATAAARDSQPAGVLDARSEGAASGSAPPAAADEEQEEGGLAGAALAVLQASRSAIARDGMSRDGLHGAIRAAAEASAAVQRRAAPLRAALEAAMKRLEASCGDVNALRATKTVAALGAAGLMRSLHGSFGGSGGCPDGLSPHLSSLWPTSSHRGPDCSVRCTALLPSGGGGPARLLVAINVGLPAGCHLAAGWHLLLRLVPDDGALASCSTSAALCSFSAASPEAQAGAGAGPGSRRLTGSMVLRLWGDPLPSCGSSSSRISSQGASTWLQAAGGGRGGSFRGGWLQALLCRPLAESPRLSGTRRGGCPWGNSNGTPVPYRGDGGGGRGTAAAVVLLQEMYLSGPQMRYVPVPLGLPGPLALQRHCRGRVPASEAGITAGAPGALRLLPGRRLGPTGQEERSAHCMKMTWLLPSGDRRTAGREGATTAAGGVAAAAVTGFPGQAKEGTVAAAAAAAAAATAVAVNLLALDQVGAMLLHSLSGVDGTFAAGSAEAAAAEAGGHAQQASSEAGGNSSCSLVLLGGDVTVTWRRLLTRLTELGAGKAPPEHIRELFIPVEVLLTASSRSQLLGMHQALVSALLQTQRRAAAAPACLPTLAASSVPGSSGSAAAAAAAAVGAGPAAAATGSGRLMPERGCGGRSAQGVAFRAEGLQGAHARLRALHTQLLHLREEVRGGEALKQQMRDRSGEAAGAAAGAAAAAEQLQKLHARVEASLKFHYAESLAISGCYRAEAV